MLNKLNIESVKSDKEIVDEYVQNLNPTIKKDKEQLKATTYAADINSEIKVQE